MRWKHREYYRGSCISDQIVSILIAKWRQFAFLATTSMFLLLHRLYGASLTTSGSKTKCKDVFYVHNKICVDFIWKYPECNESCWRISSRIYSWETLSIYLYHLVLCSILPLQVTDILCSAEHFFNYQARWNLVLKRWEHRYPQCCVRNWTKWRIRETRVVIIWKLIFL